MAIYIKKTVIHSMLCCVLPIALSAVSLPSVAATSADDGPATNILLSYKDYSKAGYAVRWQVKPEELLNLLNRIQRYQYLIYYTSESLAKSADGPMVQFGFFPSQKAADKFVKENRSAFSNLRTVSVAPKEHSDLFAKTSGGVYWLGAQGPRSANDDAEPLFRLAKDAYINKDFNRALQLYSLLALSGNQETRVWAQELVAVNYERLRKNDAAEAIYRDLLNRYPEGAWVSRIEQRLRALETAALDGKDSLRRSKYENEVRDYYWRGVFGQTYTSLTQSGKYTEDQDVLSVIATHFDLTGGTTKWRGHKLEARLSGYDLMDQGEEGDAANTRIKRFYIDYTHLNTGVNVVAGRQRDNDAGVYGYFDGAAIKYPYNDYITVGAKAGVPVRFTEFYDSLEHMFFSVYGDIRFNQEWGLSGYWTQQTLYSEVDRAAYGGKAQYTGQKLSTFVNVDFDYEFATLNLFRWSANYQLSDKSRLSASYGQQRNPFLSSTNIKVGQPFLNVQDYLRDAYNRQYLKYNALSRTSIYEYGSLSYSYRVDEKLHITTDFYQSLSSDVPVFESEDGWITSDVSFYGIYRYSSIGVQAVALGFFGKTDAATMSYRFGSTSFATTNTLQFSERFKLGKSFTLNPKIGLRQSKNNSADTNQTRIRISLAGVYKPWKNTELRLEAGNEVIQDLEGKNSLDESFVYAGYQARF